jgi:CrcB protein
MAPIVLIALGGSLGAIARYGVSTYVLGSVNSVYPWGTLVVNLSGCLLLGVCVEVFDQLLVPANLRSFIAIGFLGAYTTFSTYSLETINLLREGEFRLAGANVLVSNILGLAFLLAGIYLSRVSIKALS